MDRVDMIKHIDSDKSHFDIIKEYFDEVMTLYDLIGSFNNIDIHGDFDQTISFTIEFKDSKMAKTLHEEINDTEIIKYNKEFKCRAEHNDNKLYISLY